MFRIEFDAARHLLSLKLSGFWTEETMARFADELVRTVAMAQRTGYFDTLSDSTDFPVQSPEVAAQFAAMMARMGAVRQGRLAVVVASTLNKLQAERALGLAGTRVFLDPSAALTWLAESRS